MRNLRRVLRNEINLKYFFGKETAVRLKKKKKGDHPPGFRDDPPFEGKREQET
jgi:hypothetical protein